MDTPAPAPRFGWSRIRVSHSGICGSDMHAWHGHDERRVPPMILGHEAAGIAADGPHAGKTVTINPLISCNTCADCQGGRPHVCADRALVGMAFPGTFAEEVLVPDTNIYPTKLAPKQATLTEPLACALHAVQLATTRMPGAASAIVLGGGAIGLLAARCFALKGLGRIDIAETNPLRRSLLADTTGARPYDPLNHTPAQADIVLDAVGSGRTRHAASALVRPGGTIVHIGLQDCAGGLDTRRLTIQEITFVGSYCYAPKDFRAALALLEDGNVSGDGWTECRPLDQGQQAFTAIHDANAPPKIILTI
ncbi:alcohol dehydrogenase catalytic domain-containing protein [Algicella marina]|nr:alcohol dehydrogenase catalytic domain-containing protein [Algicella marina]